MKCPAHSVARRFALACWLAASAASAHASCWVDPSVLQQARRLAAQGFPNAARSMPEVIVCEAHHFAAGVGGDYTSGIHRIRIPVRQLHQGLTAVLAHELAHAEVTLAHGDEPHQSHSRRFFLALLRAGHHAEAERVAQYVPGGHQELHAARSALRPEGESQPPQVAGAQRRWVQVCQAVPRVERFLLPDGRICIQQTWSTRCRLVPQ